jgi:hypothetical protein
MNKTRNRWLGLAVALLALMLVSAACGKKSSAAGAGGPTLKISSPADGASVGSTVTVKLDSSVALGDPSTGDHHVHICIDVTTCGSQYVIAYGNSVQVTGLSAGKHTILASLRNADHSDAGVSATITVTVGAGGSSGSATPTASGYGY